MRCQLTIYQLFSFEQTNLNFMTIKILLADDGYLIQETVKAILRDEAEIEIIGVAKDGAEAVFLAKKLQPNIVLLDIEMPKMNGIEATEHICKLLSDTKVIVLSSHNEQEYITKALEAGAASYLLKNSFIGDLKQAIYSLSRGYSYIETRLLNQALDKIQANNIVNSQNSATKTKKYRKGVYVRAKAPLNDSSVPKEDRMLSPGDLAAVGDSTTHDGTTSLPHLDIENKASQGINKANLAPIFDLSLSDKIESVDEFKASLRKTSIDKTKKKVAQRRKLIYAVIAIASFIFSVIIFS